MFHQVISISLLASVISVPPTAPAALRITASRVAVPVSAAAASRALIANPYVVTVDSSAAVSVGNKMRDRLAAIVDARYWLIFSRADMNTQLGAFGFPRDAVLPAPQVLSFARALSAQIYVSSDMTKGKDGLWTLRSRIVGMGNRGTAGHVFTLTQAAGTMYPELGNKMADLLNVAFKAYLPAKDCFDAPDAKKAQDGADKALKILPDYGMANRCLADLEWKKDSVSQATIDKMNLVIKGDPLSIDTYNMLAVSYFARVQVTKSTADSAKVVETYLTMVRVNPTDQVLLLNAVKVFNHFGRPNAADTVAAEMLAQDPNSQDALDLAANACLSKSTKEGYQCALDHLERFFIIDTTRADTTFYSKIIYAAMNIPDSARFAHWAERGLKLYSSSPEMIMRMGLVDIGRKDYDKAVAQFKLILIVKPDFDTDDSKLIKLAVKGLLDDGKTDKAIAILPTVKKTANSSLIEDVAGLVLTDANAKRQDTVKKDYAGVVAEAEAVVTLNPDNASFISNANYFIALAGVRWVQQLIPRIEAEKSCDLVKQSSGLIAKIEKGIESWKSLDASYYGSVTTALPEMKNYLAAQMTALTCTANH